ncbi:MAG: [FeFe] hydrogenase H-cluster radical SAM maturase HydG [Candidatus Cloacimonetes bacterium]|nr:[FeFe] hydrogenase H-cluster radical SAM maturase HydG [Candidatus Cloacimonadota bacterium]
MNKEFINEKEIWETINTTKNKDKSEVRDIFQKAEEAKGLNLYETSVLLHLEDQDLLQDLFSLAKKVKETIYGNRIVLFVPLYITNECSNICDYCGFRADNVELKRKTLTFAEIQEEVEILEKQGHKRILAVYGETLRYGVEKMAESIEAIYSTKSNPSGEIRRVNVNSAPLSIEDFKILKQANIGTYQCFQETYHKDTYQKVHIAGAKKDYQWRLNALHRAQEAGIDDVAIGVLYGLFDPYFETLAMLKHSEELEKKYNVGPHTISFPRLEPAFGSEISSKPPYMVNDELFKKIVAVIRLAVPYTGMILSTRETAELRHELINLGVSQISAGSKTSPGSYHESNINIPTSQQFKVGDERLLDDVIYDLISMELLPSFCTACYRLGRHGECFMDMAKNLHIKSFCQPNAILTFAEYIEDYSSEKTKKSGYNLIDKLVLRLGNKNIIERIKNELSEIKKGKRDIYH